MYVCSRWGDIVDLLSSYPSDTQTSCERSAIPWRFFYALTICFLNMIYLFHFCWITSYLSYILISFIVVDLSNKLLHFRPSRMSQRVQWLPTKTEWSGMSSTDMSTLNGKISPITSKWVTSFWTRHFSLSQLHHGSTYLFSVTVFNFSAPPAPPKEMCYQYGFHVTLFISSGGTKWLNAISPTIPIYLRVFNLLLQDISSPSFCVLIPKMGLKRAYRRCHRQTASCKAVVLQLDTGWFVLHMHFSAITGNGRSCTKQASIKNTYSILFLVDLFKLGNIERFDN